MAQPRPKIFPGLIDVRESIPLKRLGYVEAKVATSRQLTPEELQQAVSNLIALPLAEHLDPPLLESSLGAILLDMSQFDDDSFRDDVNHAAASLALHGAIDRGSLPQEASWPGLLA